MSEEQNPRKLQCEWGNGCENCGEAIDCKLLQMPNIDSGIVNLKNLRDFYQNSTMPVTELQFIVLLAIAERLEFLIATMDQMSDRLQNLDHNMHG